MELITVLKDYIRSDNTDYALLISGDWGCGKTHFLKNELFKLIRETQIKIVSNGEKKDEICDPIYISLFGVKETNEIDKRVFLELNPYLKSKPALFINLLANKLGGVLNINMFNKSDIRNYLSVFNIPSNKILCFDDLERINEDILEEALGYINTFVEHQNLKVIIVGDENILREKVLRYDKTKEKLIRFTYSFSPDIRQIFDYFLEPYSIKYKAFLGQKKDFICKIFIKGQHKNLRTLRFCLDLLEKVFEATETFNLDDKYKPEILDRLTFFTTTFSIEYKKTNDKLKLSELQQINNQNILLSTLPGLDQFLGKNKQDEIDLSEISYKDQFLKTYLPFDNHYFNYFDVIATLAYTGFIDIEKLKSDTMEMADELSRKEMTQESLLIQKMADCFVIRDDEFAPLLTEILKKVEIGAFDFKTYPNLFTRLLQIEHYNLEEFKINEDIIKKFEQGIEISKKKSKYIEAYRRKIPIWKDPEDRYKRISEFAIQANESLLYANVESYSKQIIPLIEKDMGDELYNHLVNSEFITLPIFLYLDPVEVFKGLLDSNNLLKYSFSNGLSERYKNSFSLDSYKKELGFFVAFLDILNNYIDKQKVTKISTIALIELRKVLNSIVSKPV